MTGRRLRTLDGIDISVLKAAPPRKVAALRTLGINTILDLLTHYPRRWVDRTNQAAIATLSDGEAAVVTAKVTRSTTRRLRNRRSLAEIVVTDGSGVLTCSFFNQPWRSRQFAAGQDVTVFGKVTVYRASSKWPIPSSTP